MKLNLDNMKGSLIKIGLKTTKNYKNSPLEIRRTVYYNIFILSLSIITCALLLLSILKNPHQNHESPFFYIAVIILMVTVFYLLLKGFHWVPIIAYTGVILHAQITYFPHVPSGLDAYIISILAFINIIWLLISYYWWHWLIYFINIILLYKVRITINKTAWHDSVLSIDAYLSVINAYNLFMMIILVSIGIYFLLKRERQFAIDELKASKRHEEMYEELLASFNLHLGSDNFNVNMEYEGYFDQGTLCLNRIAFQRFFLDKFDIKNDKNYIAIIFMDLDGLKSINDTFGHSKGDEYISRFIQIIKSHKNHQDIIFRIGGDEFVMASVNENIPLLEEMMNKIRNELITYMKSEGITGGVSYGIAHNKEHSYSSIDEIIEKADGAMYDMKRKSKEINIHELET